MPYRGKDKGMKSKAPKVSAPLTRGRAYRAYEPPKKPETLSKYLSGTLGNYEPEKYMAPVYTRGEAVQRGGKGYQGRTVINKPVTWNLPDMRQMGTTEPDYYARQMYYNTYGLLTPNPYQRTPQGQWHDTRQLVQRDTTRRRMRGGHAQLAPTYIKGPLLNEAQGVLEAPPMGNYEGGGGGWGGGYDYGGGGGGGGGYTQYPNYWNRYNPGQVAYGGGAQPTAEVYGVTPEAQRGYAEQNSQARWMQLLTNWRI